MGNYTSFADFKDANGDIDWAAYDKAKIANGEKCCECGQTANLINPPGYPDRCYQCKQILVSKDRLHHQRRIRCPGCGATDSPYEMYDSGIYQEGDHKVVCPHCDTKFSIETRVEYTFVSPPSNKE